MNNSNFWLDTDFSIRIPIGTMLDDKDYGLMIVLDNTGNVDGKPVYNLFEVSKERYMDWQIKELNRDIRINLCLIVKEIEIEDAKV